MSLVLSTNLRAFFTCPYSISLQKAFITSFYPLEAFCSANMSFAVSLLMSKQLVHVGTQKRSLSENCCTSQFVYEIYTRGAKRDPTPHW